MNKLRSISEGEFLFDSTELSVLYIKIVFNVCRRFSGFLSPDEGRSNKLRVMMQNKRINPQVQHNIYPCFFVVKTPSEVGSIIN